MRIFGRWLLASVCIAALQFGKAVPECPAEDKCVTILAQWCGEFQNDDLRVAAPSGGLITEEYRWRERTSGSRSAKIQVRGILGEFRDGFRKSKVPIRSPGWGKMPKTLTLFWAS
jgi:hypothetical protein